MSESQLPDKQDVARALLLRGSVFIHLDPRQGGVQVPTWLSDQPQLVLQIGLDLPIPIVDLRVDGDGVFGTLAFHRDKFACFVPWHAVFALVGEDGKGMVWQDALPSELVAEMGKKAALRTAPKPEPTAPKRASKRPTARASVPPSAALGEDSPSLGVTKLKSARDAAPKERHASASPSVVLRESRPASHKSMRPGSEAAERTHIARLSSEGGGGRSSEAERPGKRKRVELPPYLRVIK